MWGVACCQEGRPPIRVCSLTVFYPLELGFDYARVAVITNSLMTIQYRSGTSVHGK